MEELFRNNVIVIYIIACLAVISYTNFKENQRMFLLYLFTYGTACFGVFSVRISILLLGLITFVFLEYLTEDEKKLELITKPMHKLMDYCFMIVFQYHILWILLAFFFLTASRSNYVKTQLSNCFQPFVTAMIPALSRILSVFLLWLGAHFTISQAFKVKSVTEITRVFETNPIYKFEYREEMKEKFDLLCAFEDKTYFERTNSYSCISFEFFKCLFKNHGIANLKSFSVLLKTNVLSKPAVNLFRRGYSTPEMQLLRTIGIIRGYDKYKIQRKIYEILYSQIFFSSLKEYHRANTYSNLTHYRHYILFVYFQNVLTKINGKTCMPLSSAFQNPNDISNWSMNGLFVACLGLSFRKVNEYNLNLFYNIIDAFDLDREQIKALDKQYPSKFPSGDPQK